MALRYLPVKDYLQRSKSFANARDPPTCYECWYLPCFYGMAYILRCYCLEYDNCGV